MSQGPTSYASGLQSIFRLSSHHFGRYIGEPICRWLPDGRRMELVRPFGFVDPEHLSWPVQAGVVVDGASIPPILWSITGGPFEGKYRDASIIHDFYCDTRERPCADTHRTFLFAMLVSGVSRPRALAMYMAVRFAGPKWSDTVVRNVQLARNSSQRPEGDFQPHLDRPVLDEMGSFVSEVKPPIRTVDIVSDDMRKTYVSHITEDPRSAARASAAALNRLREAKEHFSHTTARQGRPHRDLYDFGPPPPRRFRPED